MEEHLGIALLKQVQKRPVKAPLEVLGSPKQLSTDEKLFTLPLLTQQLKRFFYPNILYNYRGVMVITTVQLHSTKSELRFCAGSNPACGVSEIHHGEVL